MAEYDLLCLARCYRRPAMTANVLRLLLHELPDAGVRTFVVIGPDPKASQPVLNVVEAFRQFPNVVVAPPSKPVLSAEHGQRWIHALNEMSDAFDATGHTARWLIHADDDVLFSRGWETQFAQILKDDAADAYMSVSLFLWDDKGTQVNLQQHHWSPWLCRYNKGDRRRTDREIGIVDAVQAKIDADPKRLKVLPFYHLDYGTCTDTERSRCFRECARAGKLDDYTRKYLAPPQLMDLSEILNSFPNPADFMAWQRGLLGHAK